MLYFGVIGHPIGHSASPIMHNTVFRTLNIDAIYLPFDVKPENLKDAVYGARALGFKGLNVTIPHKEEITKYVKPVGLAERIGAVNTVDVPKLEGYNTDAIGALRTLEAYNVDYEGKVVLIVGAGGVARAIAFALAGKSTLIITNRTASRGLKLAEDVRKYGECIFYPYERVEELKGKFDILINCTPLGMKGFEEKLPVPESLIENVVVFDTVYNPIETPLIKLAKKRGCKVIYGLDMLVYQGAEAFKIWFGFDPPILVMRDAVVEFLRQHL
ncbi:shikimate dehydrogenase [Archaeoglobus profundus]|uniref:Shikimate dehydrogenase (NADP(+)) n=1 Tax=Archaeoglobus profundus (strain DSM 5631 / JCM 9629 / NBRC 100127 / Av18) TaxID=572546 RepID=D2RI15_ARCPA|nr:shikimate dehydrogenase [Archaeoglobus profundus]ADB57940.1 shikimate 5-dehydrogenase [Archaeoglobus profundus DSM 5631]